jgi:hypothetical protein
MVQLKADDTWALKDLGMFLEPVEISDANGNLLGIFVPANLERGKQLYAKRATKIDPAEIERRKQSSERGATTEEVFRHLQAITTDPKMREYLQTKIDAIAERNRCVAP